MTTMPTNKTLSKNLLLGFALATLLGSVVIAPQSAHAQSKPAATPQSDKLDVRDLEKKYWASKDTDFSVVQNRTYSKVHRFSVSAQYGEATQDPYNAGSIFTFNGNYYFTERYGMGLTGTVVNLHDNDALKAFENLQNNSGAYPNHTKMGNFYGASFNWVPIYAKMSLLNSRVIYFDMSFSPGLGVQRYDQQLQSQAASNTTLGHSESSIAGTLDITQHYFFTNHWALRIDWSHRFYSEKVADWGVATNHAVETKTRHDSILSGGMTFFF